MKKLFTWLILHAAISTLPSSACTNLIVGKEATGGKSVFVTYSADNYGSFGSISEIKQHSHIIQMHGFYVDEAKKYVFFDLIFDFEEKDPNSVIQEITNKMKERFTGFEFNVILDTHFAD